MTSLQRSLYMSTGNFDWVNGVEDGEVVFNPNPHGRFKVAWMPSVVDGTEHLQNQVKVVNDRFFPDEWRCRKTRM